MFEHLPIETRFLDYFAEPRESHDFDDKYVPVVSPDSAECGGVLNGVKQKFIAAYYYLNQIEMFNEGKPNESHVQEQRTKIKDAISALQVACTPFGFWAQPIQCEQNLKRVAELKFTHPRPKELPKLEKRRIESSRSFCITLSIPGEDSDHVHGIQSKPITQKPQKVILKSSLSPGDILMLTAAVRDLHQCCPGEFMVDVRTSCDPLWKNNPHIKSLNEFEADVKVIDCEYPLVHQSNQRPFHFIHGYSQFLNSELGVNAVPTEFRGDIHLSDLEKTHCFLSKDQNPEGLPIWIICAGGKYDYTIKWWHWKRYQTVVDTFKGKMLFVQVGEEGHFHPALDGVLDLRGKTNLRDMVHLMHWADGLLCGVTFHMHLAAAVPLRDNQISRPAVIIAGGREAPHWEAYPTHQYLHTVGMLSCCAKGGCWKSRTLPLGDGDIKDEEKNLCVDVVNGLPHCMDLISVNQVTHHIEMILAGTQ